MNKDLQLLHNKLFELLKQDDRILGAWEYGSSGKGESDELSDLDIAFIIKDEDFISINSDLPFIFQKVSSEIILNLQRLNFDYLTHYAVLYKVNSIEQFDLTFIKKSSTSQEWSKIFYTWCNIQNILFDKYGDVKSLIENAKPEVFNNKNLLHTIEEYWYRVFIQSKYLKRADLFKILHIREELFYYHLELLHSLHSDKQWERWSNNINKYMTKEEKESMLLYFGAIEDESLVNSFIKQIKSFSCHAEKICNLNNIDYPFFLEESMKEYVQNLLGKTF